MNNNDIIIMSSQELSRLEIIQRVVRRELTQVRAAEALGLTDRWVRKLVRDYNRYGVVALVSKRRGKLSNRAYPGELKTKVLNLVKENYYDFGPTLACEKLLEKHDIKIHQTTLRGWMISDGVFRSKRRKTVKIHQSRERRACFGELVQIDGSHHDWFEGRREKCCLIVFIDDATNLVYCRFEESETTLGYMRATKDYVETYGKPVCFYSDKHTIFKSPDNALKPNETQFQRACTELGITTICANTPQAKGRVERVNGTLQDRLVKELRLNSINTLEKANEFLPQFLTKFNQKFIKPPKSEQNLHSTNTLTDTQLDYVLSIRTHRTLTKNLEFNFNNNICQLTTKTKGYRLKKAQITITENTNHEMKVFYKNKQFEFTVIDKDLRTRVTDNKNIDKIFEIKPPRKYHTPSPNHPWRTTNHTILKAPKVSQIKRKFLNLNKPDLSKSH